MFALFIGVGTQGIVIIVKYKDVLVGFNLKRLREMKNLGQADIAESLNTDNVTVSRWENGKMGIEDSRLKNLCAKFNVEEKFFYEPLPEPNHAKIIAAPSSPNINIDELASALAAKISKPITAEQDTALEEHAKILALYGPDIFNLLISAKSLTRDLVKDGLRLNSDSSKVRSRSAVPVSAREAKGMKQPIHRKKDQSSAG